MLSLPLITPHEDLLQWTSPTQPTTQPSSELTDPQSALTQSQPSRQPRSSTRSALSLLTADENLLAQRKLNVRRFGAGWIRPPGIPKTYQATMDEIAEREEQEQIARREQQLLELANAQEAEARRDEADRMAMEGGEGGERDLDEDVPEAESEGEEGVSGFDGTTGLMSEDADGEGEVDLDDEVPEAEESGSEGSGLGDEEEERTGEVAFNEESFIEGSMLQADVEQSLDMEDSAELSGLRGGPGARDLDDDIPEAGEYEHTDTELEDSTSELTGLGSSLGAGRGTNPRGILRQSFRSDGASSLFGGGSSFLGSSPVAPRGGTGNLFSQSQQAQARQARRGRGRGREN